MELKTKLLEMGVVEDNDYLTQYIELINSNKQTTKEKYKHQEHHIIPKSCYKINGLTVDNSNDNLVYLTHYDHLLAHYLLYKCSKYPFKQQCALACKLIFGANKMSISEIPFLDAVEYNAMIEDSIKYNTEKVMGHTMSEESRRKLSKITRERMLGSVKSEETKMKISNSNKGKAKSAAARENMSKNHADVKGNKNPASGRHWFNNGINRLYLKDSDVIPDGYTRGNLPKSAEETRKRKESLRGKNTWAKGSHWFNNGVIEIMAKECPDGFKKGRLKK